MKWMSSHFRNSRSFVYAEGGCGGWKGVREKFARGSNVNYSV